ncbi:unnamed protein product [Symbiodinium sp. CCMP2592]|nr:unnamed protein product [Symbiodinium sp. CCMP2592]
MYGLTGEPEKMEHMEPEEIEQISSSEEVQPLPNDQPDAAVTFFDQKACTWKTVDKSGQMHEEPGHARPGVPDRVLRHHDEILARPVAALEPLSSRGLTETEDKEAGKKKKKKNNKKKDTGDTKPEAKSAPKAKGKSKAKAKAKPKQKAEAEVKHGGGEVATKTDPEPDEAEAKSSSKAKGGSKKAKFRSAEDDPEIGALQILKKPAALQAAEGEILKKPAALEAAEAGDENGNGNEEEKGGPEIQDKPNGWKKMLFQRGGKQKGTYFILVSPQNSRYRTRPAAAAAGTAVDVLDKLLLFRVFSGRMQHDVHDPLQARADLFELPLHFRGPPSIQFDLAIAMGANQSSGNGAQEILAAVNRLSTAVESLQQTPPPGAPGPNTGPSTVPAPPPAVFPQPAAPGPNTGSVPFPPMPPPSQSHDDQNRLRYCKFCKQVSYWRKGICLNESCRDLNVAKTWAGREITSSSDMAWYVQNRKKKNKGLKRKAWWADRNNRYSKAKDGEDWSKAKGDGDEENEEKEDEVLAVQAVDHVAVQKVATPKSGGSSTRTTTTVVMPEEAGFRALLMGLTAEQRALIGRLLVEIDGSLSTEVSPVQGAMVHSRYQLSEDARNKYHGAKTQPVPVTVKVEPGAEQGDASEKAKDPVKGKLSNLVTQCKNAVKKLEDHDSGKATLSEEEVGKLRSKKKFYDDYCQLPRNATEQRMQMLSSWEQDKTGKMWAEKIQSLENDKATTASKVGWEIADQENLNLQIPEQKKLWESILEEIPYDEEWNQEDNRERALAKAGERRYHYGKTKMTTTTDTVRHKETMQAGYNLNDKEKKQALQDSPNQPSIEVRDPLLVALRQELQTMNSGKKAVERNLSTIKDLQVFANTKGLSKMKDAAADALTPLDNFLVTLREDFAKLDALDVGSEESVQQAKDINTQAGVHVDAAGRVIKKLKTMNECGSFKKVKNTHRQFDAEQYHFWIWLHVAPAERMTSLRKGIWCAALALTGIGRIRIGACMAQQVATEEWVPLWLPHELLHALESKAAGLNTMRDLSCMEPGEVALLRQCCEKAGLEEGSAVALGIWGDGVPITRDRTQSAEVLSLNILSHSQRGALRFPLALMQKHLMLKEFTWDAVLSIMAWSFAFLAAGISPSSRHDGTAWLPSDKARRARSGLQLPRAFLIQVRGDWAFYKQTLYMPAWNRKDGCCWLCNIKPSELHMVAPNSPWMHNRKSHWDAVCEMPRKSPLLGSPFFSLAMCQLDWLHIVDIGVALEFQGSLFHYVCLKKLQGNLQVACRELFFMIKEYYSANNVGSQLGELKPTMLKGKGKPYPKLRAKAAESRALVPFSEILAQAVLVPEDPFDNVLMKAASSFARCYDQLSKDSFQPATLAQEAFEFASRYVDLNKEAERLGMKLFKIKPKLHMFLELSYCCTCSPSANWCYRDEDFAGKVAMAAFRRGGANTVRALAESYFLRWKSMYAVPELC